MAAKRSAVDNVAADKLDQAGIVPRVALDSSGLHRIPKVIPAETNALSMCERYSCDGKLNTATRGVHDC